MKIESVNSDKEQKIKLKKNNGYKSTRVKSLEKDEVHFSGIRKEKKTVKKAIIALGLVASTLFAMKKGLPKIKNIIQKKAKDVVPENLKVNKEGDSLFESIKKAQPNEIQTTKMSVKKAGNNMSDEETKFYGEVLDDFENISTIKKEVNPFMETETFIKTHINGEVSEITNSISRQKGYGGSYSWASDFKNISLTRDGEIVLKLRNDGDIWGDELLVKEYKTFLNNNKPSKENFEEFLRHRDLNYVKDNEITDIKAIEKTKRKGEEIKKAEELYYKQRQEMYKDLWRPYPTQQFYRVVGKDELMKMLRGEEIISKNSKARYGRNCVDITPWENYQDIFYGETKFRIPFKRKNKDGRWNTDFTSKIFEFRPEKGHYQIPSYNINDVDVKNIKVWNGSEWQRFDI